MILVSADSNGNLPEIVNARLDERFAGAGGGFDGPGAVLTGTVGAGVVAPFNQEPPSIVWQAKVDDVHVPDRGDILMPDPTNQNSIQVVKRGLYFISCLAQFTLGSVDPEGDFVVPERSRCRINVGLDMNSGDFGPAYYPYPNVLFELDPAFAPTQGMYVGAASWSFLQPLDAGDVITLYYYPSANKPDGTQAETGNVGISSNNDIVLTAGYAGEWAEQTDD